MILPEWFDLDGRLARLQGIPVVLQFRSVNFRPGFYESALGDGQATAQTLNGVHCKDCCFVLIVRMKMRAVVLSASFDEHPDDDSEEPRKLWHARTLHRPNDCCRANGQRSPAAAHDRSSDPLVQRVLDRQPGLAPVFFRAIDVAASSQLQ
jgi:hypothetical protein